MSVRAYKLVEVRHNDEPTFSFSNEEMVEWLSNIMAFESLNMNGTGFIEVPKVCIEHALEQDSWTEEGRAILLRMLKECGDDDYAVYYAF